MGFSYSDLLQPLMNDRKILEQDGIPRIYGGVATISSDNLSAHALAGFCKSCRSGLVCRICMIMHNNISLKHMNLTLRTSEMHCKSTYGVTGLCPFDVLDYFSTTKAFLPRSHACFFYN